MRMMKGDEEPEMTIGAIIFLVGFTMVGTIILIQLTDYTNTVKAGQDEIKAIDEAHLAASCLIGNSEYLAENGAKQSKLDSCGIDYTVCIRDIATGAYVTDPETKKTITGCPITNPDKTIYIPIESGNSIHMGELSVKG